MPSVITEAKRIDFAKLSKQSLRWSLLNYIGAGWYVSICLHNDEAFIYADSDASLSKVLRCVKEKR